MLTRPTPLARALRATLLGLSIAGTSAVVLVAPAQAATDDVQRHAFAIPTGSLDMALGALGQQAGVMIAVDSSLTQGLRSAGLQGRYSVEEALQQLLAPANLQALAAGGGYRVVPRVAVSNGQVELGATTVNSDQLGTTTESTGSYTTGATTIGKSTQSLRETPQTVTVVTRQFLDDKNLNSLDKVLEKTPGISFQYRNFGGHLYTSRGFSMAAESFLYDGVPGQAYQVTGWMKPDTAIYDRIEVLRGATGLLVGAGEPGGAVNMVRKRPTAVPQFSITSRAGSWDNYRMDLDGSGSLNESGSVRGRLVAAYEDAGSYMDARDSRTPLLYGIVEADLSDDTTLTMSLRRQTNVINGYSIYGLPRYSNGNALDISRSTNLAQDWNRLESDMNEVFTEVAHRFNDTWTSKTSLTYSEGSFDQAIAYARGAINPATLAGSRFQGVLFRSDEVKSTGLDSHLNGSFDAFGLEHEVTLGATWSRQAFNTKQATVAVNSPINIFDVNHHALARPSRPAWGTDIDATEERSGLYGNVRLRLAEPLSLVLGGRATWYTYDYDVKTGAANSYTSKETRELTPFVGLLYDLNENWTWYTSYADIFTPQGNYRDVSGSPLDPAVGTNYETGLKGELFDKRLNLSMALFYIKQEDVAVEDVDNSGACLSNDSFGTCYSNGTVKRSKGFDIEASGEVLPGLQVFGGYTYNMVRSSTSEQLTYETPKHMLRLNASYNLPGDWNRLTLGTGVTTQSAYAVPNTAGIDYGVAGYAIWDARASWKLDEHWKVSLNAENLFDRKYYTTSAALDRSNLFGEPRSYVLTLRGDF